MSRTKKTSTTGANPALAQARVERRRSNAAGTHLDKRSKRARTRGAQQARALRDQAR